VALTLTLGAACTSKRTPGEAALNLTGRARLTSASGKVSTIYRNVTVRRGESIYVSKGAATLEFSGGRRLELRQGSAVKADRTPSILSGDALLVAPATTKLTVRSAGSTIVLSQGAARLSRGLGIEAAAYRGTLTLTSAGHSLVVPALRQAGIPSLGVVPARPEPLRLQSNNVWDRRFLGDAIELTEQLQTRSDGLTGQLRRSETRSVGFFTTLLPVLDGQREFNDVLLNPTRPAGETLVGASIAAAGHAGDFAKRWQSVFAFRDAGAAWGLVALDQRVSDPPGLSSAIDAALARANSLTLEVAAPVAIVPATVPVTSPGITTNTASAPPATTALTTGSGSTDGTTPPPDQPAPAPAPGVLQPVVDTVNNVVGGLLSTLQGKK
jgi:hypothetical protein